MLSLHRFGWLLASALSLACQGASNDSSPPPVKEPKPDFAELVERGEALSNTTERSDYGVLKLRADSERTYSLEVTRNAEQVPTRRVVARAGAEIVYQRVEAEDEFFADFALHPSGELTLALERRSVAKNAYELERLTIDGVSLGRAALPPGVSIPAADRLDLPEPAFLMKSRVIDALTDAWLHIEPQGEALVAAFSSLVESSYIATGVMALDFSDGSYRERWARVVEGRHTSNPPAWAYDEFRWREAVERPLLAVAEDGRVVVGRTWTQSRCKAMLKTFGEFSAVECGQDAGAGDTERQPFAFTVFSETGARTPTRTFIPTAHDEFVVFDMTLHAGALAIVGSAVIPDADGQSPLYPAAPGEEPAMVDYDGYLALLELETGAPRKQRYVDQGRGDYLAAVRSVGSGLIAVGASDWDRWYGGMSISRGSDPLLAYVANDDAALTTRLLPFASNQRHFHLLSVDVQGSRVVAAGLADAPMTHSGDKDVAQRTFGGLTLQLSEAPANSR